MAEAGGKSLWSSPQPWPPYYCVLQPTELSGAAAHILRAFQSGLSDTSWAQTNPCLVALRPEKAWFGCS